MTKIQRRSLAVETAELLQQEILKGKYAINQQLPVEQKLMECFGVGRSTIREAMKILVNSGYLRVQQGLGTFVEDNTGLNQPLYQTLKNGLTTEVDEVRQLLEIKMAERAAIYRTGNDISRIQHYVDKRLKAANTNCPTEFIEAHINLYLSIATASKNLVLADIFRSFTKLLRESFTDQFHETGAFNTEQELYQNLYDSIMRQDPSRAVHWMAKINRPAIPQISLVR